MDPYGSGHETLITRLQLFQEAQNSRQVTESVVTDDGQQKKSI
jgi:hypothetical protein